MKKLELTYEEIERLQFILKECLGSSDETTTKQHQDMLEALLFKLIAMRAQMEYLKSK